MGAYPNGGYVFLSVTSKRRADDATSLDLHTTTKRSEGRHVRHLYDARAQVCVCVCGRSCQARIEGSLRKGAFRWNLYNL